MLVGRQLFSLESFLALALGAASLYLWSLLTLSLSDRSNIKQDAERMDRRMSAQPVKALIRSHGHPGQDFDWSEGNLSLSG